MTLDFLRIISFLLIVILFLTQPLIIISSSLKVCLLLSAILYKSGHQQFLDNQYFQIIMSRNCWCCKPINNFLIQSTICWYLSTICWYLSTISWHNQEFTDTCQQLLNYIMQVKSVPIHCLRSNFEIERPSKMLLIVWLLVPLHWGTQRLTIAH